MRRIEILPGIHPFDEHEELRELRFNDGQYDEHADCP